MFDDADPGVHGADSLTAGYRQRLREAVETVGVDGVVSETALDRETVESVVAGDGERLTLSAAASILALVDPRDADSLTADARDRLLLAMSSAVVDVDALERGLGVPAKELQQKIEGRRSMTVAEYAEISAFLGAKR